MVETHNTSNGTLSNVAYNNGKYTNVTLNKGTINGSLYGGALGAVGTAANVYGPVHVAVYGGSVKKTDANGANGSGGVYGANNIYGAPLQSVEVDIYGTDPAPSANEYALFAVYGGGNAANYTYGNGYPKVRVHNCNNSIEYVYGGGNAAAVAATDVTIYGGNVIGNVFGGGNGTVNAANVTGNAYTKIYGGTILKVFGGSNSNGTIGGTITVDAESQKEGTDFCPIIVTELYAGGNLANSNAGTINIGCMNADNLIDYVYGGANQANVTGNITLNINGGRIEHVFGGNNIGGNIDGDIVINVAWDEVNCTNNYLGYVYGAGNLATYTQKTANHPEVNIKNAVVTHNVYGGGKGDPNDASKGVVTGLPTVTIGDATSGYSVTVGGDVFGGGDAAGIAGNTATTGKTSVTVGNKAVVEGNVFGGGNAAPISQDTHVLIKRAQIYGNVYGGGNQGAVGGNTKVIVNGVE